MKIHALGEGSFSVDSTKKFVPFNPLTDNVQDRKGSIFIHVQPFLLQTENDLILMDAGLGFKNPNGELMLHDNIRKAGFEPEEVTLVLMSHLHNDHTGGLVLERNGRLEPAFPDAEHVIQRGEWEFAFSEKSVSYKEPIFEVLQRSAPINLVEGSGTLKDGITYELTGGHCQFHQVFKIVSQEKTYFFGGDVLPEPEQLIRKFAAKYDFDGRKSMELREEFGELATAENWICLFYHAKNLAIGRVTLQNGFSVKSLDA
jgi:glyoxylase-like metal-dependent hydrolase (beta-lactamase superfamily II)